MKTNTIFLILIIASLSLLAYSETGKLKFNGLPQNSKYTYCELVQQDRYFASGSNTNTFLNFGSKSTYQNRTEESSYIKLQRDGVDALNYMSENEWEMVVKNAREITNGIEIVYLLRKKIQ